MGAVATWDYTAWSAAYPEFSNVNSTQAANYWTEATLYHANDGTGPVRDAAQQAMLLNLLTAHIAFLRVGTAGNPSPASQGLVGRVSSASQGSVSVGADLQGVPGSAAWYAQSPYGLSYWQATTAYRLGGHYRAGPSRYFGPGYGGRLF